MAAEPEGIAHGYFHGMIGRFSQQNIQSAGYFRAQMFRIDRSRNEGMPDTHQAGDRLDGAGGPQEVAGHGFGGADDQPFRFVTKKAGDGSDLAQVAYGGGGSMRLQVGYLFFIEPVIFPGLLHGPPGAFASWVVVRQLI